MSQGLRPGDRVALHWSNSIEAVQLYFALFKAGLVAVAINVRLTPAEIRYILNHSQSKICFSSPALARVAEQAGADCRIGSALPQLEGPETDLDLPSTDPDQPAVILYTSGTTARPKGVMHSHRSLFHTAEITSAISMDPSDVGLPMTPLMHAAALAAFLIPLIYIGASLVLVPGFDPAAILDAVERFQCTLLLGVPTLMHFIVEEQTRKPRLVSSLRNAMVGGDSVSAVLQDRFAALFGLPLQVGYAMTEVIPITFVPQGVVRAGSIGIPPEAVEVRIVGPDGEDVRDGETGEVLVRSPANCIGYWHDPAATEATLADGWLRTGDLASRDAGGYYWFKGRKKEIIIRAGSNISPQEVEEALYHHPAVLDAGVVGEADPVYGEQVVAFVALRSGQIADEESLREFARQRLAEYKIPERVIFVDEIPKGLTGKVQRRALKEKLLTTAAQA